MSRVLLAHNPAYWPSLGGSERVLQRILEGVREDFDRVVVVAGNASEPYEHNGIEVRPYGLVDLRRLAVEARPAVYFPNMVHSGITARNLQFVSRLSGRTVLNMIGGYPVGTPLRVRARHLRRARRAADVCVHVDPLSTEAQIDLAIEPRLPVRYITQGLDHAELDAVRTERSDGYFVHAHNLWSWKAPDVFLRELVARAPDLRFKMIAAAETGDAIEQTVEAARPLPNVEVILGPTREEFLTTLAGAAAVVSTSTVEGAQPNILLEAGYLGVPYLSLPAAQNFGHYPHAEMFPSVDGLRARLVDAGPSLREGKRPELERARALFAQDRYRWDRVVEEFRALFSSRASQ